MRKKIFVFSVIPFLFGWFLDMQAQSLDSLERVFETGKLDASERLNICHDLSYAYAYADFRKAVLYARKGIALAEKENNPVMTGAFWQDLGIAYYMFSRLDSAAVYLNTALEYAEKTGNEQLKAATNAVLGSLFCQKGNYSEAMQYYMQALPILEKENKKEQLGVLYGNIADLYQTLHNHDRALDFYLKAEAAARELDDRSSLGCVWIGMSGVYLDREDYEKALDYAEKARKILQPLDDKINEVIALNALAQCYYKGYKNYDKAVKYAEESMHISEESGFPGSRAVSLQLLSDIAFSRKEYKSSEDFAFQALKADSSDVYLTGGLISNIISANIAMGNRDKANDYFKKYTDLINSRANKEFQSALSEMQVKYETEKQNLRIVALEKEKQLSDRLAVMGGILLLAVIVIMSLRYRMIRNKKRLAEQHALQQIREQQLAATKAVLEGETSGQSRLAKMLHDSLGTKLSVVKMNLLRLRKNDLPEKEIHEEFDKAMDMLDGTIKELNRTSVYIMPESLMQHGLKASLTDFCMTTPRTQFLFFGKDMRLDSMLELTIYRTVYELVTAALQHEGTSIVCVQLVLSNDHASLTIQENNAEFDIQSFESTIIAPIRNRIKPLRGFVNVNYSEKTGTETDIGFEV